MKMEIFFTLYMIGTYPSTIPSAMNCILNQPNTINEDFTSPLNYPALEMYKDSTSIFSKWFHKNSFYEDDIVTI